MLGLTRSNVYYRPVETPADDLRLMRLIDEQYTLCPFCRSRRMTAEPVRRGEGVNRKRVRRLLRVVGLEAVYPKPRLSTPGGRLPGVLAGSCTWRRSTGTADW